MTRLFTAASWVVGTAVVLGYLAVEQLRKVAR